MKEIALNILDIAQNSIRAEASELTLKIKESDLSNELLLEFIDNGTGIGEEMLQRLDDPYTTTRTKRKIGMGIPLLKYHAELAGGGIQIQSKENEGTRLHVWFRKDHIDRQPLGDLVGVIKILLSTDSDIEFYYQHNTDKGIFKISSPEIKKELGVTDIKDNQLLRQIGDLVFLNLKELDSELK